VSQSTKSCRNDNNVATKVTNVRVTIKGVVNFKARSSATQGSKWGTVKKGTSTAPYHFAQKYAHYISTTNGPCGGTVAPPTTADDTRCINGVEWNGSDIATTSIRVMAGVAANGIPSQIQAWRMVMLARPGDAMRIDTLVAPAPAPVVDRSTDTPVVTVATRAGSAATGSARLTAQDAGQVLDPVSCTNGTATGTQSETDYDSADYTNGSTPLTLTGNVGTPIRVANSSTGDAAFSVLSYS